MVLLLLVQFLVIFSQIWVFFNSLLGAAREWVYGFVHGYNEEHRHSGIQFVTPAQCHNGAERSILVKRDALYQAAKQRNPERWSRGTRNWEPVGEVWLNPENEGVEEAGIREEAA